MKLHENPISGDWTPERAILPDPPYGPNDVGFWDLKEVYKHPILPSLTVRGILEVILPFLFKDKHV